MCINLSNYQIYLFASFSFGCVEIESSSSLLSITMTSGVAFVIHESHKQHPHENVFNLLNGALESTI